MSVDEYVTAQRKTPIPVFATTWANGSVGTSDAQSLSSLVTQGVGNSVDRFIEDYTAANPAVTAPSGASIPATATPIFIPPTPTPHISFRPTALPPPAASSRIVWVNTKTRVYHLPGSRWFGKTKNGKYLPENIAVSNGYHRSEL